MDIIGTYAKKVSEQLKTHKQRMLKITNEAWFPSKRRGINVYEIKVVSLDEAIKLTHKPKSYFMPLIQSMLDLLRLQYNRKYIEDFGDPYSATYSFSYHKSSQELTLYAAIKIKGMSNTFHYQTSAVFRLNESGAVQKVIGDEFLWMLAYLGNKTEVHSKDSVKEILRSLDGSFRNSQVLKKVYSNTEPMGPVRNQKIEQDIKSTDNTIRI